MSTIFKSAAVAGPEANTSPATIQADVFMDTPKAKKGRLLQNSLRAGNFRLGRRAADAEDLIDGERHHAEHEVAFDLDRAAHAYEPCAEFILQPGVDAFGHGPEIENHVVRIGHVDEFHAFDFASRFGLGFVLDAKVAIDDRRGRAPCCGHGTLFTPAAENREVKL